VVRLFGLGRKPQTFEFRCESCGKIHRGSPSFSLHRPEHIFDVPESERDDRVLATDDLCVILPPKGQDESETTYWIRATLDIPIKGVSEPFCWGVWVSQSKEAFERYRETFDLDQSDDGSFGWLPVHMAHYRNADGSWPMLKCNVEWGPKGKRPKIEIQECDNQIYLDLRDGISWEKAIEIAAPLMHRNEGIPRNPARGLGA